MLTNKNQVILVISENYYFKAKEMQIKIISNTSGSGFYREIVKFSNNEN